MLDMLLLRFYLLILPWRSKWKGTGVRTRVAKDPKGYRVGMHFTNRSGETVGMVLFGPAKTLLMTISEVSDTLLKWPGKVTAEDVRALLRENGGQDVQPS